MVNAQEEFLQDIALVLEYHGLPRIAGRMFGAFLVSPKARLSADDLVKELHASRASVSTMTRLLLQQGVIERVHVPGERKDYFRFRPQIFSGTSFVNEEVARVRAVREVLERGRLIVEQSSPGAAARLEEMLDLYRSFESELPAIFERWKRKRETGIRSGVSRSQ
jgi:DNA-binding transcriptional regulator GbsR (MarR family)